MVALPIKASIFNELHLLLLTSHRLLVFVYLFRYSVFALLSSLYLTLARLLRTRKTNWNYRFPFCTASVLTSTFSMMDAMAVNSMRERVRLNGINFLDALVSIAKIVKLFFAHANCKLKTHNFQFFIRHNARRIKRMQAHAHRRPTVLIISVSWNLLTISMYCVVWNCVVLLNTQLCPLVGRSFRTDTQHFCCLLFRSTRVFFAFASAFRSVKCHR